MCIVNELCLLVTTLWQQILQIQHSFSELPWHFSEVCTKLLACYTTAHPFGHTVPTDVSQKIFCTVFLAHAQLTYTNQQAWSSSTQLGTQAVRYARHTKTTPSFFWNWCGQARQYKRNTNLISGVLVRDAYLDFFILVSFVLCTAAFQNNKSIFVQQCKENYHTSSMITITGWLKLLYSRHFVTYASQITPSGRFFAPSNTNLH